MFHYSIQLDWPSKYDPHAFGYQVEHFDSLLLLKKDEVLSKIKNEKILAEVSELWYLNRVDKLGSTSLQCLSDNHNCHLTISPIGENQETKPETKQTNIIMSNAFAKFREKATASENAFLRLGEIDGTVALRVIPWLHQNKITPIHFYYEGWVEPEKKGDSNKPIRFEFNHEGGYDADEDTRWARGDYGLNTPVGAFVFVALNEKTQRVNIISGVQKTLLGPLSEFCDPDSDRYVKNWSSYKLLITRDKKTKKFTIEREKLDEKDRTLPKWATAVLEDFHFSMENYMASEKTPEGEGTTYRDVLDVSGDQISEADKEADSSLVEGWGDVTTSKGVALRKCTLEELKNFKSILDKKANYDKSQLLYRAILSGIKANEQPEFLEEEASF